MYETFNASSSESLDSIFNRLQKIVIQLTILDLKSKYDKLRIELNKSESDLDSYKKGLASVEEQLVNKGSSENVSKEVKKTSDAPIIENWVSDCDEDETIVLESLNVQKHKQADQPRERKFVKP
ncbi:hypothetical protein Tco_1194304 [Tanacetum coccineum]